MRNLAQRLGSWLVGTCELGSGCYIGHWPSRPDKKQVRNDNITSSLF